MIKQIYIEAAVRDHPRVAAILARFPDAVVVDCERYSEIFNKKAQDFRLQKQAPALILAHKHKQFVLPTPEGYGIGRDENYYFSHMMNCLYDCRYCFLQGMYHSANYVLFVNYEDFDDAIRAHATSEDSCFFSGYDCDSLALEPVSGFVEHILALFETLPHSWLELRTKSTQIRSLLNRAAMPNVIVAFSVSPDEIVTGLEQRTPSLHKRLEAMQRLQQQGWPVGLRIDPLIYTDDFSTIYTDMFNKIFTQLDASQLHSVTLGTFRLPQSFFRKTARLYPDERLFALDYTTDNGMTGYTEEIRHSMINFCEAALNDKIDNNKLFVMEDS